MRPKIQFLNNDLLKQIISEAIQILCELGMEIHNKSVLTMLADHGATVEMKKQHVKFTEDIIQKGLNSVPSAFKLYDINGKETNNFSGYNVHFTPGSSALNILDYKIKNIRKPITQDYIQYAKIVNQLEFIASQSTAFIPSDVPVPISDSYRLFLSLLYGEKPVVTGTFSIESFNVMKDFQIAVRGNEKALKEKPLTVFSCCSISPLKWGEVTSQNIIDCAKYSIPVELISMPLAGFTAPVTLVGTLVMHTAEILSGIVISQLANPGTPILYGGSPAIFDVRFGTTPMGAIETMMIECAYNEIGKSFGIPTQAYIALSDAKQLDAQAGQESGTGSTLAVLAGINNISGPGLMDFENCFSLEKLVMDNEICKQNLRLIKGMDQKEDFPALSIFKELLKEQHLLASEHTMNYLQEEHVFPGTVIDRMSRARWNETGEITLEERAHNEVENMIKNYQPTSLSEAVKKELEKLMETEAKKFGQTDLPERYL